MLHSACDGGNWDIIKWLVDDHGADPKAKTDVSYRYEECIISCEYVIEYISWFCSVSKLYYSHVNYYHICMHVSTRLATQCCTQHVTEVVGISLNG